MELAELTARHGRSRKGVVTKQNGDAWKESASSDDVGGRTGRTRWDQAILRDNAGACLKARAAPRIRANRVFASDGTRCGVQKRNGIAAGVLGCFRCMEARVPACSCMHGASAEDDADRPSAMRGQCEVDAAVPVSGLVVLVADEAAALRCHSRFPACRGSNRRYVSTRWFADAASSLRNRTNPDSAAAAGAHMSRQSIPSSAMWISRPVPNQRVLAGTASPA